MECTTQNIKSIASDILGLVQSRYSIDDCINKVLSECDSTHEPLITRLVEKASVLPKKKTQIQQPMHPYLSGPDEGYARDSILHLNEVVNCFAHIAIMTFERKDGSQNFTVTFELV